MRNIDELMNLTKKYESKFAIIIFILIVLIHIPWINFQGVSAADTQGYIDVSENWFNSSKIYLRPIVYPIIIFLSKIIGSGEFGAIVYLQIIFYAMSGVLFYKILIQQKIKLDKILLAILVLISFSVPQALQMNEVVLPEMLPLIFILLLFHYTLKPSTLKNSIIISVLILVTILMKPLWLLLLAFPIIKFIYSDKRFKNLIFGLFIPLALTILLYSVNQYMVAKKGVNAVTASTFDVNTNLSLIRMGLINGSKNTKLNSYLDSKSLLSEVSQRSWTNEQDEFSNFTQIKNQIPWEYREDSSFWKTILLNNPSNLFKYFSFQLSRLPTFFSTSGESGSVKFLPEPFNNIYQRFFSNIHSKHIVGILFVFFASIIGLFNFKHLSFHKIIFFLVIGVGIVLCLLTYQDPHFRRMRAVIEPIIIYITLFTLIKISKYLYHKINKIKSHSPIITTH